MVPGPRKGGGGASLGRIEGAHGRARKKKTAANSGGTVEFAAKPTCQSADDENGTLLGTLQGDVVFHPVAK